MLSATLKRTLLSSRSQLPPTFLLPWTAGLTTVSHESPIAPPPSISQTTPQSEANTTANVSNRTQLPNKPRDVPQPPTLKEPLSLSHSIRELLPLLRSQGPHYINLHIHGKPYLLTEGDTLRLPFFMHGVEPGDVLRLNRALNLGSRDFTLKPGAAAPKLRSTTSDHRVNHQDNSTSSPGVAEIIPATPAASAAAGSVAPHFIPHIAQGKHAYLDERLYECRAVVVGTESEPLRIKEKTKRRQRHVKRVKSKHRYTVLRIKELRVRSVEELDEGWWSE